MTDERRERLVFTLAQIMVIFSVFTAVTTIIGIFYRPILIFAALGLAAMLAAGAAGVFHTNKLGE